MEFYGSVSDRIRPVSAREEEAPRKEVDLGKLQARAHRKWKVLDGLYGSVYGTVSECLPGNGRFWIRIRTDGWKALRLAS